MTMREFGDYRRTGFWDFKFEVPKIGEKVSFSGCSHSNLINFL